MMRALLSLFPIERRGDLPYFAFAIACAALAAHHAFWSASL